MISFEVLLKLIFILIIAYYFQKKTKAKIRFFILGILFFILSLILQLPFKFVEYYLKGASISIISIAPVLFALFAIITSELTKYFSLRKYLKTKSPRNGILFGLGWVGFESISYFSYIFYFYILNIFSINFRPENLISASLPFWDFIFLFIVNSAITILIIFSVIKKKLIFLFYGIYLSLGIYLVLYYIQSSLIFEILFLLYSLFLIFRYNSILK